MLETPICRAQSLGLLRREVEELRASRKRLLLTADDDRRRIEHDLHEGRGATPRRARRQLAARGQVDGLRPTGRERVIAEMARDVQQALEETARLAQRIYPPLLEVRGLGRRRFGLQRQLLAFRPASKGLTEVVGIAAEVAAAARLRRTRRAGGNPQRIAGDRLDSRGARGARARGHGGVRSLRSDPGRLRGRVRQSA